MRRRIPLGDFNTPDHHGYLSASDIASHLPIKSPGKAPEMLERLLRSLANFNILECKQGAAGGGEGGGGGERWLYGLAPLVSKYFVCDHNGVSLAPLLLFAQDKVVTESWYYCFSFLWFAFSLQSFEEITP
ncbi:hypothetical protein Vadar_008838 [Vaccinium darrowii]|uniref:Uncharacterized protein n=1 Tax=Vaccinium darrowii TaxID=229202 RepID=A0ACB7ZAH4_9ERIC|nr:hypothetical protein Vadar_008838 [Vaccinium darrowii]